MSLLKTLFCVIDIKYISFWGPERPFLWFSGMPIKNCNKNTSCRRWSRDINITESSCFHPIHLDLCRRRPSRRPNYAWILLEIVLQSLLFISIQCVRMKSFYFFSMVKSMLKAVDTAWQTPRLHQSRHCSLHSDGVTMTDTMTEGIVSKCLW